MLSRNIGSTRSGSSSSSSLESEAGRSPQHKPIMIAMKNQDFAFLNGGSNHSTRSWPNTMRKLPIPPSSSSSRPTTPVTTSTKSGHLLMLLFFIVALEIHRFLTATTSLITSPPKTLATTSGNVAMPGFLCVPMIGTPWEEYQKLQLQLSSSLSSSSVNNNNNNNNDKQLLAPTVPTTKESSSVVVSAPERGLTGSTSTNSSFSTTDDVLLEQKPREIVLVHVGKAGGITLRQNVAAGCQTAKWEGTKEEKAAQMEACQTNFNKDQTLALQTRHYIHMWDYDETAMKDATTFLVTLRNPVDRIVSAYRYSHPQNCERAKNKGMRGCSLERLGLLKPGAGAYRLFVQCFPSAAMEDFAQALMNPYRPNEHFQTTLKPHEQWLCRRLAKTFVQGKDIHRIIPHFQYNYQYYASQTWDKYTDAEIVAVRTEHEWDDMIALDQQLGGSGRFRFHHHTYSHGSEDYYPSPLSEQAYHKLCCVLEREIEVYLDVLQRSVNLDGVAKQESENDLKDKCGVTTTWLEWRLTCLRGMDLGTEASPGL